MEVWIELRELSRGQQEAVVTSGSSRARGEKQFCRIQWELKSGQRSCLAGTKVIEDSGQRCWSKEEEIFWLLSSHPLIFLPVTPIYQTQRKPEGKGAQMKWSIRLSPKSRMCVCVCVLSHPSRVQLFTTLWTVAHQPPLSMGTLQAKTLEWVAMSSSRGSSQPRDWTPVSPAFACRFFTTSASWEAPRSRKGQKMIVGKGKAGMPRVTCLVLPVASTQPPSCPSLRWRNSHPQHYWDTKSHKLPCHGKEISEQSYSHLEPNL